MKTVYIVILCDRYTSEMEIYNVYKSKTKAERIAEKKSRNADEGWWDYAIVKEFKVY